MFKLTDVLQSTPSYQTKAKLSNKKGCSTYKLECHYNIKTLHQTNVFV